MSLEMLTKKLAQLGQETKNSVQKMSESYQMNTKLSEQKRVQQRLLAGLGELALEFFGENPPEGMEEQIKAIRATSEEIARLEETIQKMKGIRVCPGCGREVQDQAIFCSCCGEKLPEQEVKAEPVEEAAEPAEDDAVCGACEGAPEAADGEACCCAAQDEETADVSDCCCGAEDSENAAEETCCCGGKDGENAADEACCCENSDGEVTEEAQAAQAQMYPENEDAAVQAKENAEKLRRELQEAGAELGDFVNGAADKAKVLVGSVADKAGAFVKGFSSRLTKENIEAAVGTAREEARKRAAESKEVVAGAIAGARKAAAEAAEQRSKAAEAAAEAVEETVEEAVKTAETAEQAVEETVEEAVEAAVTAAEEIAGEAVETAEAVEETVKDVAETAAQVAEETVKEAVETAEAAAEVVEETAEAAAEVTEKPAE
ncbi:MAG: hypothetical protein Q4B59_02780 [Lachnospiraceae bacterium]|nr:hypothetical protein [Lachnospiraceae bacterium]